MTGEKWNPRYEAYARAHGNTPDAQMAADRIRYRGGKMAGFINWIAERWAEYGGPNVSRDDHAAFDAWLAEWQPDVPVEA